MAFLIPDNLRSRNDAPAGVKRAASAFQVGLDDTAVVWYEPLYDPAGDKPHLVVLLPDRGIIVLEALEVKAGGVLGVLRGKIRLERDGREVEVDNPLARAERLANTLRQRIGAEGRLVDLSVPVVAGAVLGALTREEAATKRLDKTIELDRCLFRPDLDAAMAGTGEAELLRAFARMLGGGGRADIDPALEKVLRGLIQPETVIERISHAGDHGQLTIFQPPKGGEDIVRVMDRQQESMAKSLGEGHRIIRGVAGSGKTLILVFRARLLARMFPQHRFLVACYTRALAGQLRALLSEHRNIDVINLDKLMYNIIREAGLRFPGYEGDDADERVAEVARDAVRRGAGPRYHAILLDEAQDFCTAALQFVAALLLPGRDDLVIVADAAQNIFRRRFSWRQAGIQAQGRTRILRINYRNTREILDFASRFLLASENLRAEEAPDFEDENAVIPPESAARSGPRPELEEASSPEEEVALAVARVRTWVGETRGPREIGVLYASSGDDGQGRIRTLRDGLRQCGSVYWLTDPDSRSAKDRLAESRDTIVLTTIHSAKGMEFPRVVLCGVWKDGQDLEVNRKLAYVGMTRATERLVVVTGGSHPLIEDLRKAAQPLT